WTNLWNENPWIEDPDVIEPGWKLRYSQKTADKPEDLHKELVQRLQLPQVASVMEKPVESDSVTLDDRVSDHSLTDSSPQQPTHTSSGSGPLNEAQISFLGNCESGMTASRNSG